jgi:tetratricopeptide (TPR) repeat protein
MSAGRSPLDADPGDTLDVSGEVSLQTVRADAFVSEAHGVLTMHRRIAYRLLREGHPARALTELVRASREVPMTALLGRTLGYLALRAGTPAPAITLLTQGLEECEPEERLGLLRALARLLRRTGERERARELLVQVLAERPGDRRARRVLNALLEHDERWEELDASLEKETREALRRGTLKVASRTALRRARLWAERLRDPVRASLRYGQAAQYAEQARDLESAFLLRLLWVRSLHQSKAPPNAVEAAVQTALLTAEQVGHAERVRALVRELGIRLESPSDDVATSAEVTPADPAPRLSTQIELLAIAEAVPPSPRHQAEVRAVLAAAVAEGSDPAPQQKLEALLVAAGQWRELAQFYRDAAGRAANEGERAGWAEKLAELLESELDDLAGAAQAWAQVVAATGDPRAVQEQVRLLAQVKDKSGVQRALDVGVARAQSPEEQAAALVLRAEQALVRREVALARADFEQALTVMPTHAEAAAGLAELALLQGDAAPVRELERALSGLPRYRTGRGDLYRRLARLADQVRDARLARDAWLEVASEYPGDEEAARRLLELARRMRDDTLLEAQLLHQLEREPRGTPARAARLELVAVYERTGREALGLTALRTAVEFEPGHREAWLALADRLEAHGVDDEGAWALEQAGAATAEPVERLRLWRRLARICRERLHDEEKAQIFEARVERLQKEVGAAVVSPAGLPLVAPRPSKPRSLAPPRPTIEADFEELVRQMDARLEPEPSTPMRFRQAERIVKRLVTLEVLPSVEVAPPAPAREAPEPRLPLLRPAASSLRAPLPGDGGSAEAPVPARAASTLRAPARTPPPPLEPEDEAREGGSSESGRAGRTVSARAIDGSEAESAGSSRGLRSVVRVAQVPAGDQAEADGGPEVARSVAQRSPARTPPVPQSDDEVPRGPGRARPSPPRRAAEVEVAPRVDTPLEPDASVLEVGTSDLELPEGALPPPARAPRRGARAAQPEAHTAELPPVELGDPQQSVSPSFGPSPSKALSAERVAIFDYVRANPLEPDGYRSLAEHFDTAGDATRSSLMLEITRALEGDPNAAPRAPRLILSTADRQGLRHPLVRGEPAELLGLLGPALCRLIPARGKEPAGRDEFRLDMGKGARGVADSLLVAVRVLGVRAPDVLLSEDPGPPFAVVGASAPRLMVGKLAVKKVIPDAELRFFAGRALFTLASDLLALRLLRRDDLLQGMQVVGQVMEGKNTGVEARVVREAVPARSLERVRQLWRLHGRRVDLSALTEGARHSVNRAGLVVCGGIAPAVAALRAKKALNAEVVELVRFAASERYLKLRGRNLAPRREP